MFLTMCHQKTTPKLSFLVQRVQMKKIGVFACPTVGSCSRLVSECVEILSKTDHGYCKM